MDHTHIPIEERLDVPPASIVADGHAGSTQALLSSAPGAGTARSARPHRLARLRLWTERTSEGSGGLHVYCGCRPRACWRYRCPRCPRDPSGSRGYAHAHAEGATRYAPGL